MAAADLTITLPGYRLVEQIYSGSRTVVYRGVHERDERCPVVIKLLRQEYPTFHDLLQFRNQYAIAKNLDLPGIVRPLCLKSYRHSYALVMEDFGGVSLRDYARKQPLAVAEVLAIALQLTDILHALYQHRVIHKDIKPANILIQPESKQIQLIDFSIASLLPKETEAVKHPNVLEGTLAYLAPEQTGRMNRGIDYRTDFYALGVTLFELLAGELPFQSKDPLELVHCHIAKPAPNLCQIKPEITQVIGQIVAKLMAKNTEDRYQSALGLKHDLEICLARLQEIGQIELFEIGMRDVCDRFTIPEKLYGRETEVQKLLAAFDAVAAGSTKLMLVAGFSGIGKTAVVHEVHKPIVKQRGYFIKGKFDQFNRNIPFSAFVQAFRDLLGQLLSESDAQLQVWRSQILAALGDNGQVIVEVIPELEKIIGQQPPAPELSGTAAQNRFNLLFQKFIQIFTTPAHPLVMFLDDLQWADSASLNLIQLLMAESATGYLLLIGAYRDNEVFAAHPLMLTLDAVVKAGAKVNTITLQALSQASLNHLVADTLHCTERLAQPLTDLVYQKTQGNPFFTTQFLKALHQDRLIEFNLKKGHWQCDIVRVRSAALTSNVVEFMAMQLQKLPQATQEILKLAACIGNQFDLGTLAIVSENSPIDTATDLWKALQSGLILPISETYKFFQSNELDDFDGAGEITVPYKFLHDRIQQAAYSLIPEDRKQAMHLRIGQLLLQQTSAASLDEKLFTIVSQFNLGIKQVVSPAERDTIARLNLNAARKARLSAAYIASAEYCETALRLMPDVWLQQPAFALELYIEAANSAYPIGAFERVDRYVETVCQHTSDPLDRVKAIDVQIQSLIARNQLSDAIQVARNILQSLGVELPEHPTSEMLPPALKSIRQQLAVIEDVAELPPMSDRAKIAAMNILSSMASAAYIGCPALYPLIVLKQVELSLQFGNAIETPYAYATYGLILCAFGGEIVAGNRSADIAIALMEKLQAFRFKAKILNLVYPFTRIWQESLHSTLEPLCEGYQAGLESGDLEFAAYCAYNHCSLAYAAGSNLVEVQAEMQRYGEAIAQLKQTTALNFHQIGQQAVLNWLGETAHPQNLIGTAYDETSRLSQHQAAGDTYSIGTFYAQKLILTYHFGLPQDALAIAQAGEKAISGIIGTAFYGVFPYYHALTLLANWSSSKIDRSTIEDAIAKDLDLLTNWAIYAPTNFTHRCQLIRAEQQRVLGRKVEAIDMYDRAISEAKENGFIQEEALSNELSAKFYLDWGKEKIAAGYMQEAYYCYAKWGAKAKTDDLEQRYPNLLHPILQQAAPTLNPLETLAAFAPNLSIHSSTASNRSSSSSNIALDFAAILKASQALSSTIQLDELLRQLTQIILQNSGGDRCALILPERDGTWRARAIATPDTTELCSQPLEGNPNLPIQLIQYVKNTQEVVAIDDCQTDLPIIDEYLNREHPKSVLCLPILNQGRLIGILSLKNHSIGGAFTSDRILVLNFLCTQAAISLENARLYELEQQKSREIAQKEAEYRSIFESVNDGLSICDLETGNIIEVNPTMYQMSGYTKAEYLQLKAVDLLHPDYLHLFEDYLETLRANQEFYTQGIAKRKDGSFFDFDLKAVPFTYKGKIHGLTILRDISDRKAAEMAIQQKSQQLEQTLQELQQAQLHIVQSEKMSALGNLVAGVAHEINNPVGFIYGNINEAIASVKDLTEFLQLYQEKFPHPDDEIEDKAAELEIEYLLEDLPKMLTSIQAGCDRIQGISTSLRTFSRADKDYKVPFNLHAGIDSTILILKHRLKAQEHRPEIQAIKEYGKIPEIQCFPGQLNQVFMNILANAIDALEESNTGRSFAEIQANPNRITIRTTLEGEQVKIAIADNGKGMSEAIKARIFDHLFTTKAVGKGTGLGLAIAHQIIVEKHGGKIDVNSEVGKGTEFVLTLPLT